MISPSGLPDGLSLDSDTGMISGVPVSKTRRGGMDVTIQVTDSNGATAEEVFNIVINRP